MSGFFGPLWWFIVTLGVLVTFHEFGHFWVARRCGVKVLCFSVGFGRALWSRVGRDGTRYQIALIPLGGYVKMLDERDAEVAPSDRDAAFNRQPVLRRMAIIAAGPIANLLLCIGLYWGAFVTGLPDVAAVVGKPSGLAAEAGLREGDHILRVGDESAETWSQVAPALALAAIDRHPVTLQVRTVDGNTENRQLPLDRLPAHFDQTNPLAAIGLGFLPTLPPVVGSLAGDAAAAGLIRPGDRILAIGDRPIAEFADISPTLQQAATSGDAVPVRLRRDGAELTVSIRPKLVRLENRQVWQLGVAPQALPPAELALRVYGPAAALREALAETGKQTRIMLGFLGRLVTGQASTKNLSGAIGIAQAANAEASLGFARLLAFMAGLSLTLCIINLLPIPVLDGGHLLYYLIELVSGRPVSERVLMAGQYAGLVLLAGLILLANANDLLRLT